MLLDESEKIGKARLASADVFQSRISENAKNTRQAKLQIAKRCFDALRKYQEEVQQVSSVSERRHVFSKYRACRALLRRIPCRRIQRTREER